jgi:hypothetical protein
MSGWARELPIVQIKTADQPKPVTLILPYYESPEFFKVQCEHLRHLPSDLAPYLTVIVVDDGSPTKPLRLPDQPLTCKVRAFRIERDVPWNWLAARNIGAHHAPHGWLLLTDMDHLVPHETIRSSIWGAHKASVIYGFARREHTGALISPHSASFLMHRDTFWLVGGYDEALSGYYGTDGDWRRRCARHAQFAILSDVIVRHEYVADGSSTAYPRKSPDDAVAVKRIVAHRGPHWRPKTLSFPYHELAADQPIDRPVVQVVESARPKATVQPDAALSFVVSKWPTIPKYRSTFGPETVNMLRRGIAKHYPKPHRFICVTDQPDGIDADVEIVPAWNDFADLPSPSGGRNPSCYRRLRYFAPDMAEFFGPRFVSLDLDTVIVGDLRPVFDRPEDFVIWGDTNPRTFYNGGLWMQTAGARSQVWTTFDPIESPKAAYRAGHFGSDQGWISHCLGPNEAKWTAADGVYSYRNTVRPMGRLPENARLVSFHGEYDPWDKDVHKHSPWVREHYRQ